MKFKSIIFVRIRENVSDSAGNAVKSNVNNVSGVNIQKVNKLRIGKLIDIDFEAPSKEYAQEQLKILTSRLLSNSVIEDWEFHIWEDV